MDQPMNLRTVFSLMFLAAPLLHAGTLVFESPETPVSLVELYSSEGCSSCPPADAWISKLKTSPDLWKSFVPVAFHVDYWDNLGWKDPFASREFTNRQRRYTTAWRTFTVYTPGVVLNGREWRNWSGKKVPAASEAKVGRLKVTLNDDSRAEVVFVPAGDGLKPAKVELAFLGGDIDSDVKRGENGGRKLHHEFVALHLSSAELAANSTGFAASIPLPKRTASSPVALAAWVIGGDAQPPIQATGGWLKPR
jgi:hypothetical protein